MSNILFGECLKFLMSTLDISNSRLSKAINVDSSLVSRWIHEKRVPPYNSSYIESIAEYLSSNVYNTLQEEKINKIFTNIYRDNSTFDSKAKIKKMLLEAQGRSIELIRKKDKHIAVKEQISKVIDNDPFNLDQDNTTYTRLSGEDQIYIGVDNVKSACYDLLGSAAKKRVKNNETIYITYNNYVNTQTSTNDHVIKWRDTLLLAINNGWNVILLFRLNSNPTRTLKVINYMIPLVQTGKFMCYYVKNYDNVSIGDELVVVPKIGVLSCFSDNLLSRADCGFYFKNMTAIRLYQNHFQNYIVNYTQPLQTFYNRTEFDQRLAECEDRPSNRFLYRYCFSVLTLPEPLYERFLERKNLTDKKKKGTEFYRRRLHAFLSNLEKYEYKDVYTVSSIYNLIHNHQFNLYSYEGIESMYMDNQDIIEYLENLIHLLKTYDNYKIAFLPETSDTNNVLESFSCIVKDRDTIFFDSQNKLTNMQDLHFTITEPTIVKIIYNYFIEIWEHIAPVYKEKSEVISWLQYQINIVRQRDKN